MLPAEFAPLITAWTTTKGRGACAHFGIGRTPAEGVIQFVPINRNGNHMGGEGHGWFVDARGRQYHPNLVAVGIEIHCAGGVRLVDGHWRLVEGGVAHGAPLDPAEVTSDPSHPGRGWHRVTDYQYERLTALLADLEPMLAPMPAGLHATSHEAPPAWASLPTESRAWGHVCVDAEHRSDPWPPTMQWLRARTPRNP
jgi:hypothetical protein